MVRMAMSETDADQPDSMGFEPSDHSRSVVGCIDEERLTRVLHDVAVDSVAVDLATDSGNLREQGNRLGHPLLKHNLLQGHRAKLERGSQGVHVTLVTRLITPFKRRDRSSRKTSETSHLLHGPSLPDAGLLDDVAEIVFKGHGLAFSYQLRLDYLFFPLPHPQLLSLGFLCEGMAWLPLSPFQCSGANLIS